MDLILANIPTQMTLNEETFGTDMVVLVNDDRIPCHRGVVGTYSLVIGTAIASKFKEGKSGEFRFGEQGIKTEPVRQFLLAMYNPWNTLTMDKHCHEIYRLALVYQAPKVLNMAATAFGRLLTVNSFWNIAATCKGNVCPALIAQCTTFFDAQPQSVVSSLMQTTNTGYQYAKKHCPAMVCELSESALRRYQQAVPVVECMHRDSHQRRGFSTGNQKHTCEEFVAMCKECGDRAGQSFGYVCSNVYNPNKLF